jgi:hypothetical protein
VRWAPGCRRPRPAAASVPAVAARRSTPGADACLSHRPRSENKHCLWAKESPNGMRICMPDSRDKLHYMAYQEVRAPAPVWSAMNGGHLAGCRPGLGASGAAGAAAGMRGGGWEGWEGWGVGGGVGGAKHPRDAGTQPLLLPSFCRLAAGWPAPCCACLTSAPPSPPPMPAAAPPPALLRCVPWRKRPGLCRWPARSRPSCLPQRPLSTLTTRPPAPQLCPSLPCSPERAPAACR